MANPLPSDLHVNTPLSNVSVAYRQSQSAFIADAIFPRVPVMHQSDLYWEFKRDAFFRSDVRPRAPGAESHGTDWNIIKSGPYFSEVYAEHAMVTLQQRANADPNTNIDFATTELLTQQNLIKKDKIWLATYFKESVWTGIDGSTGDYAGVTSSPTGAQFLRWDQAGSTPREDVRNARLHIKSLTSYAPNVLVLGPYVTNALLTNPELIDMIKYTQGGLTRPDDVELLAQFFGVDKVVSAEAVENSAAEGDTLAMGFMAGKHAFLAYAAPAPGLMTPSAGYTFSWQGYLGGMTDIQVSKWYMQERKADRIEAEMTFDMAIVGTDLGIFFKDCVS